MISLLCGSSAQVPREVALHATRRSELLPAVGSHAHDRLVRDRPQDRLPDPPDGVRQKPCAAVRIVASDRFDQAEVALVDEVLRPEPRSSRNCEAIATTKRRLLVMSRSWSLRRGSTLSRSMSWASS